ncbi:serine hydrolase domain-containing protein [Ferruginibacter paludis]|uniref:serine hydrolase domain-containing protein n=1 Tax=Ferruginibacter paludis TaxID=1310417 RepID=UPI0025B5B707|nr:serine hydrolase domain-containing protein [Ferruginibacter paludis]MDN3655712.1 serine hydrolase domain-containing protein [Ferruginibacter paludis]
MRTHSLTALLFLAVLSAGLTNHSFAQTDGHRATAIESTFPVLDQIVKAYAEKNHLPGFTFGLVVDGRLVHTYSLGYTDIDKKTLVTTQSVFRIASMTKSFTAMAILKLRDDGKLQLDDLVEKYIPEMKGQHYLTSDAAPATIRNLLTHAAGFPEDNPWGDRQLAVSDNEMLAMIKKGISFSNVPGIAYEYSNMGFAMLDYIIKKVSGQTYEKYITSNILLPLGMTHTYWNYKEVPPNQLAHGYSWLNGNWVEQPLLGDGAYGAMGGMITTMGDFSKYLQLHLAAWPPRSDKETGPVKRSSLREMHHAWNLGTFDPNYKYPSGRGCPVLLAYGYGLNYTKDCEQRVIVGHSGGLPGFGSNWRILPDYGIGVIAFSNLTYAPASTFNMQAIDTIITLAKLQPIPVPVSPVLNKRKNQLIKLLPQWNDAAATGIFAANFFMDYFPDELKKEATAIFDAAGKIIQVDDFVATNNLRGSFLMEGEKANIQISFTLTPENPALIQEYHIKLVEKVLK